MKTLGTVFFFASLTVALSQSYSPRRTNNLTTSEKFLTDLHTVIHDLQDSALLKKKAVIDAVTAVIRAKIGILEGIKDTDNQVVKTVVEIELATFEATKAATRAFLKTFASKMMSLMMKLPADKLSELTQLPFFDFAAEMVLTLLAEEDPTTDCVNAEDSNYNFVPATSNPDDVLINKDTGTSVDDNSLSEKSSSSRHRILALLRKPSSAPYRSSSTTFEAPSVRRT